MIEKLLIEKDIEFQSKSSYSTTCPLCSEDRKKRGTRSLSVHINSDRINYKCMHKGQCAWDTMQTIRFDKTTDIEHIENVEVDCQIMPANTVINMPDGAVKYAYKNVEGDILFYIIRTQNKEFYPVSMGPDGQLHTVRPKIKSLYRAETIGDSDKVLVVEGEKAADAAAKLLSKIPVVSWVGGANSIRSGDWDLLAGKKVYLWPDNDKPGVKAMEEISVLIDSQEVYIFDVSSLPAKSDLADTEDRELISRIFKTQKNIALPSVTGSLTLNQYFNSLEENKTGLPIGWNHMDAVLRLPQSGLVIVEGRTGHGKTTFMLNMVRNMLKIAPDRKMVYISYEVPTDRLLTKLIMCLEGEQFSTVDYINEETYINKIKNKELKCLDVIGKMLNKQLFVTGEELNLKELAKTLDSERFRDAIVFVDYIQLIPSRSESSRYLIIKEFSDTLRRIANKRRQLIVAGSQVTDGESPYQDQAREGKDITFAAEMVLKIWNKVVAEARDEVKRTKINKAGDEEVTHHYDAAPGDIVVAVKKIRNGGCTGKQFGFSLKNGVVLTEVGKTINMGF